MVEAKPIDQTAKEIKTDLDHGKLADGSEALRQGYLDWTKSGKDASQFWTQLKTVGHFTDADFQHLALAYGQKNFGKMADGSWTGAPLISPESLDKYDRNLAGGTPEADFAHQMDAYLKQAMNNDSTFQHGFLDAPWTETTAHGTGTYISVDRLNDRIAALDKEDLGRSEAGDFARALDKKGADGRSLFERLANGKPALLPDDIRAAGKNLGAYSPDEQAVIKHMINGMDNSDTADGIAMSRLQNPDQSYKITRQTLDSVKDATRPVGDAPAIADQPQPGAIAKAGLEALGSLPPDAATKIAPDNKLTHDSLDAYLKDTKNQMSFNQRQALEKLRDSLPADNTAVPLDQLAVAAGFKTADGKADEQAFVAREAQIRAEGRGVLAGLHDNVTSASITNPDGNITPESIAARMKAIQDAAAQPGGAPLTGNNEYAALQRLQGGFNDISADGKNITPADLKRYAAQSSDDGKGTFQGFKGDAAPTPVQQPAAPPDSQLTPEQKQQVQKDGDAITAPKVIRLGSGPIIDQAMKELRDRAKTTGEAVTPQAARQLLADMAELNHWPGTKEQWAAYVQDGRTAHLPKALNGAMRANMEIQVPPAKQSPEQVHAMTQQKAEQAIPVPNLQLTPEQVAEVKQKVPNAAQATPEQINSFIANHPEVLGDHLSAQQKAAIAQRQAQEAAYAKALEEYIQSKRSAPVQPQPVAA